MDDWWHRLGLDQLDADQWEALCDGCGKCCLHKIEDADTGRIEYTGVHCRYLDAVTCRCSDYQNRLAVVPDCVRLTPGNSARLSWLPATCAYRLRSEGRPLPAWHPLVTGDAESVHLAGASIRGRTISEAFVHPDGYDEHIVKWVDGESCGAE